MEISILFNGKTAQTASVMQYDYGQDLLFSDMHIPDGTEVDFYQDSRNVTRYIEDGKVAIPDSMLTKVLPVTAYIFLRTKDSGKTILRVDISVKYRPGLGNNPEPDSEDYKRILPAGGTAGQVLVKKSGSDYDVAWEDASAAGGVIEEITEEDIDKLFNE